MSQVGCRQGTRGSTPLAADKLVNYILTRSDNRAPLRRNEIRKLMNADVVFDDMIMAAAKILQTTYGYHLCKVACKSNAKYFLRRWTPSLRWRGVQEDEAVLSQCVSFMVLSHLFLNGGTDTESSVMALMRSLKADSPGDHLQLNVEACFKKMRTTEMVKVGDVDGTPMVTWGDQAQTVVSKLEMLEVLQRIYIAGAVPRYDALHDEALSQRQAMEAAKVYQDEDD